ncbi:MAG: DNA repair protein RecN [Nitrospira bacterium HGW-Nitrospira-1]|nr:MAG: DNA repair protein RecN [Nitrospira bacterium HGW-Nitrospira-1]
MFYAIFTGNMLKELRIKNLAIIGDLSISFRGGLNVLTGETGAGKSIVVDALGLALGDRAQTDMIRSGEKEGSVQAWFELDDSVPLPDIGIDISEDIVLRRTLSSSGKSRAFINDTMVTLQTLSEIGKSLVDIHSQHEHQSLLKAEKQRSMLDSYGRLRNELDAFGLLFREVQSIKTAIDELETKVKERAYRLDLLQYQVNEINTASLKAGEKETLEEERHILSNLSKLNELTETSYSLLYSSDNSCTEQLSMALLRLREMYAIDPSVEETLGMIESSLPLIEDAGIALRGYREKYDVPPNKLEAVEDRLELFRKLEKKYGEGLRAIMDYRDKAEEELKSLESSDERLASLRTDLRMKEEALLQAAQLLTDKRKKTARKIEELIIANLKDLAFGDPAFKIDMHQEKDHDGIYIINSYGMDRIEFLFSANPGEPLKPLSRIISGGELSRVMLALKSILAEVDSLPVLIFDEVDAGIGGRTAESVGKKLRAISGRHQLLCITHLPQIASLGDFHLKIEKKDKDKRVIVNVREIDGRERLDEIARMLSGTSTETSLRHAEELLGREK